MHSPWGLALRKVRRDRFGVPRTAGLVLTALLGTPWGACGAGHQAQPGQTSTGGSASGGGSNAPGGDGGSGGAGGATAVGGAVATGGARTPIGPCDIYAADGGPCVAAHSTVRALLGAYGGPLYQVRRADGQLKDIGVLAPGGLANAAEQDAFCGTEACTIATIYDQSGKGNHLTKAPPGGAKKTPGIEADAKGLPIEVGGLRVYGEHNSAGVGYRNNAAQGLATGDDAETLYMVASGDYFNDKCCFDYGNMQTDSMDHGEGAMEAIYFGNCTLWGKGAGSGPWVMADLENGLWAGNVTPYEGNTPVTHRYVTGMVKGDKAGANHWTIKVGNAQSGGLTIVFDGSRPSSEYGPMLTKQGAVGLGTGGDNSSAGIGNFFEGVVTAHYASDAADEAVQANIVAAGYGLARSSCPGGAPCGGDVVETELGRRTEGDGR